MRAARGLVDWTVRELSQRSGIHRNTITNIETGKSGGDPETYAGSVAPSNPLA
jgi:transcriptional regulator with XRE-family HTH domain